MRRGTTPTITVHVPVDLTGCEVHLYVRGRNQILDLTGDRLTMDSFGREYAISAKLTQAETLEWEAGERIKAQVRAKAPDGTVMATDAEEFRVAEVLKGGVL